MKSGRSSKNSRLKFYSVILLLVSLFVYSNLTADTGAYQAEVKILTDDALLSEFIKDISGAKESIYIAIYMFKSYSNEKSGAGLIKKSLINAAERGVSIYVAMDQAEKDDFVEKENKKLGKELQKHNIKVVYDAPDIRMHSKCAVIDRSITYIGSHNYTNSALRYNREITARIVSEEASEDSIRHILSVR